MVTTIKVDREDLERFEKAFAAARRENREWGSLRFDDGWARKFKHLVDFKIDGDRKLKLVIDDLRRRSEVDTVMLEELKHTIEGLRSDLEVAKSQRDEYKKLAQKFEDLHG